MRKQDISVQYLTPNTLLAPQDDRGSAYNKSNLSIFKKSKIYAGTGFIEDKKERTISFDSDNPKEVEV
jgi:hypothetical protein